jgi:hypothetical protein
MTKPGVAGGFFVAPAIASLKDRAAKIRSSGLFWGLCSNIIDLSSFGRTTLAIHRCSRFRR